MLLSMTGYGRAVKLFADKTVTVEIKSLNGKYLDLNLRLPVAFKEKEIPLRKELGDLLKSGKVELTASVEQPEKKTGAAIDKNLVKNYFKQLNALCDELNIPKADLLAQIMRMPDVMVTDNEERLNEGDWKQFHSIIMEAAHSLLKFRKKEGIALEKDILLRISEIEKRLSKIRQMEPKRAAAVRGKLMESLKEIAGKAKMDINRLEQELIFYLEKFDITEEMVRLKSHCSYFVAVVEEGAASKGKKLGFIAQEIGREINTIGAKANDAGIQKFIVEMKDELEKIKEQLNNVL